MAYDHTLDFSAEPGAITANIITNTLTGHSTDDALVGVIGGPFTASDSFDFIGSDQADTLTGGNGGNKFTGGDGVDSLTGGKGKDLFYYFSGENASGETIAGGGGKQDAIVISGGKDFLVAGFDKAAISGIEKVIFETEGSASFLTNQVGKGKIHQFVGAESLFDPPGNLYFTMPSAGKFDLNKLTFSNWGSGFQTLQVNGSDGDDTIVGHTRLYTRIDGGDGKDIMSGGKQDDLFGYGGGGELATGESINGKGGFDSLFVFGAGAYHFDHANLTSIERVFTDNAVAEDWYFKGSQIGAGAITDLDLDPGAQVDVTITGKKVNLSSDVFNGLGNWNGDDTLTIVGTGKADRLIGGVPAPTTFDGGGGRDVMTATDFAGIKDTFVFELGDTGASSKTRDHINNFETGVDKLDVSAIDADGDGGNGDTAFSLLPTMGEAFTNAKAEARWFQIDVAGTKHDLTVLEFDIDGNGKADFAIELKGLLAFSSGDLLP